MAGVSERKSDCAWSEAGRREGDLWKLDSVLDNWDFSRDEEDKAEFSAEEEKEEACVVAVNIAVDEEDEDCNGEEGNAEEKDIDADADFDFGVEVCAEEVKEEDVNAGDSVDEFGAHSVKRDEETGEVKAEGEQQAEAGLSWLALSSISEENSSFEPSIGNADSSCTSFALLWSRDSE